MMVTTVAPQNPKRPDSPDGGGQEIEINVRPQRTEEN